MAVIAIIIASHQLARCQVIMDSIPELQKIDVIEHLGEKIPLDLVFTDDNGESVKLSDYFGRGKPVIMVMAYYNCPMLCTLVLNGLADGIANLTLTPGKDYEIVTVSIDPNETSQLAKSKKANQIKGPLQYQLEKSWAFLVGDSASSRKLGDSLGFKYYYDKKIKQYAHPAVVFILTEDGKISRYLYGIKFSEFDLRLSLLEASRGKIGNTIDRIILYCYHYDPDSKGYVVIAANIMKIGGAATLLILSVALGLLWNRERGKKSLRDINIGKGQ